MVMVVVPFATIGAALQFSLKNESLPLAQGIQIGLNFFTAFLVTLLAVCLAFSKKLHLDCDRKVAELGYGPALAEALDILHRYQMMPSVWSKALEWQMMHASLRDRLAAIANTRPLRAPTGTSESAGA
jgi:hypothetical protein